MSTHVEGRSAFDGAESINNFAAIHGVALDAPGLLREYTGYLRAVREAVAVSEGMTPEDLHAMRPIAQDQAPDELPAV